MILNRLLSIGALLLLCSLATGPCGSVRAATPENGIRLTAQEREWLARHPVVRVRIDRDDPPFEFFDQGRWQGMACDRLVRIGKMLGIEFRPVAEMAWDDALESLRKKDGVDMFLMLPRDKARESFVAYTEQYITYPQVIIARKDGGFISSVRDLAGKTVAIEDDSVDIAKLRHDATVTRILQTPTVASSLKAVATGRADAFIGDLAEASYLIDTLGLVSLKVAAPSPYPDDSYAMGVRKDWPELARILDKALAAIPESEHSGIEQKWLTLRYEHGIRWSDVVKWGLGAVAVALVFILRLRGMVRARTADLQREVRTHERTLSSLRQREDELQSIYMASPIGLAYVRDRVFVKANDETCRILGYARGELVGQKTRILFDTDADYAAVGEFSQAQVEKPDAEPIELRLRHKRGALLYVQLNFAPLVPRDASGGFVATLIDVTERKKAERALKESEARFQDIFNQSPMVIVLTDPATGTYVDVNERFCEVSGFSKESVLGKSSIELGFLDPDERVRMMEVMLRDGSIDRAEVATTDSAGNAKVSLLSTRMIKVGDASYALSMLLDITARKQAENALRESEEQQRLYLDRLPIACILWDKEFKAKSWNPAAEKIFGYSVAEALGRTAHELIVPEWVHATTDLIWARLMAGSLYPSSINENVTKDGRVVVCEWTNTPVCDKQGQVTAVLSMAQDATERKRAEAVMIQSEKMSMVAAMAAGMAHEVNNPLGIIAQDLQNLERRLSPALPANCKVAGELGLDLDLVEHYLERRDIHRYVTSMRAAVKRASVIISNMLQFSRMSDASRQLVNLNEVLDQSVQLAANDYDLRKKYDFKNVSLKRSYGKELPEVLVCVTEMEQVFINLLKNAAQAMFEVGTEHPCISLETGCVDNHVNVSIRDNGPGMSEAVRKKIFDPFFTTKGVGAGTGLGLSVSYSIVTKNHDGEISVASAPGQGACFSVRLPAYQKE
jgi:PAS domain S-box-containing protein